RPDARTRRPLEALLPPRAGRRTRVARVGDHGPPDLRCSGRCLGRRHMVERMETRPPPLTEKLVRALIPPASREHVVGDLNERYVSPRQYLCDALRALPWLIASRLRRTTHPIGFVLGAAYLWWAVFYGNHQANVLVATIPTAITLFVLSLRSV